MGTYVLIHGASHGVWCWKIVIPLFAQCKHTIVKNGVMSCQQVVIFI